MTHTVYGLLSVFVGVVVAAQVFVGCWIVCTASFNPRAGFCVGWLPSALFAYASYFVASNFWPFFAAALMLGALFLIAVVLSPASLKRPALSLGASTSPTLPADVGFRPPFARDGNDRVESASIERVES